MPLLRFFSAVVCALAVGGLLAGCSTTVSLEPAADANDPLCAVVSVRLPKDLAGQPRQWTDAQATGAWGEPNTVLLHCGVTPPGPSLLPCQTVRGVDWLIDDSEAPNYRVTSFGRTPAVEIYLDSEKVSSRDVLEKLSVPVGLLPVDGQCTDRVDTTG